MQKTDQYDNATTYVYDAFGNLAAEYGGSPSAAGTQYVTVDALGSTRLVMGGAQASERHDFQPFGLETFADSGTWRTGVAGYGVDTVRQKFTGQERDGESYLDYFQARYFSPIQGRFISPDPGNAGANLADPQSWNGYAYVSNNPLTYTDPTGLLAEAGGGDGGSGGGWGGIIVAGFELLGEGLADLFGFGGSHTDLSNVAWTPTPTWSVTGWGMADTANSPGLGADGGVYTIPGLLFFAQATGAMPIPEQGRTAKPAPATSGAYTSLDCAGYQAATVFLPQTKKTGLEHGGFIYQALNGTFSYSAPITGTPTAIPSLYTALPKPNGLSVAGWYHTHPLVPGYTNEAFSGGDLGVSRYLNVPGYLGAANGNVLKLRPIGKGVTTRVGSGACRAN